MNALTRATASTLPRLAAGRQFSTQKIASGIRNKPVWLSDISTYPVIAVSVCGCVGAFGYINYMFFYHPDVRVDKNKRGSVLRWWAEKV